MYFRYRSLRLRLVCADLHYKESLKALDRYYQVIFNWLYFQWVCALGSLWVVHKSDSTWRIIARDGPDFVQVCYRALWHHLQPVWREHCHPVHGHIVHVCREHLELVVRPHQVAPSWPVRLGQVHAARRLPSQKAILDDDSDMETNRATIDVHTMSYNIIIMSYNYIQHVQTCQASIQYVMYHK